MNLSQYLTHPKTHIIALSAVVACSLILYTFLLFLSVVNVSFRANAEANAQKEIAKAAELDAAYLSLSREATLEEARELGLARIDETHYVSRGSLASSRVTQDTRR